MTQQQHLPVIGWREWVSLPDIGILEIKAKIDTGARSSALHAFDIQKFQRQGKRMVRFKVHPYQRDTTRTVTAEAELIDERLVRNSSGHCEARLVIQTTVELLGDRWPIEITLTNRDLMHFRMLLGRQAVRELFLVDAGQSFLRSSGPGYRLQKHRKQKL